MVCINSIKDYVDLLFNDYRLCLKQAPLKEIEKSRARLEGMRNTCEIWSYQDSKNQSVLEQIIRETNELIRN